MILKIFKRNLFDVAGSNKEGRWEVRRPDGRLCAGTWATLKEAEQMCDEKNKIEDACLMCRKHLGVVSARYIVKRAREDVSKGEPNRWMALGDACEECAKKYLGTEMVLNQGVIQEGV